MNTATIAAEFDYTIEPLIELAQAASEESTPWETFNDEIIEYTIEYTGETITDAKYAKVETLIVGDNVRSPLNYMMQLEGGEWRVYDVVVEGISLIGNYRGSFNSLVRKGGMDNLIAKMEEKVQQNAI